MIKEIKKINWLFAFVATLFLVGCVESKIAIKQMSEKNSDSAKLSFSGISSIDLKTDSTLRINWSANSGAVSYSIYNTTSGSEVFHSEVLGQASTYSTLIGLTPGAAYKFRVRMKTASGESDDNINDASVTMNAAPSIPNALTMEVPAASAGFDSTPTIKVSGVKSGDVITLYTDNLCATTAIATGTASGTTIDLTTSALTVGAYNFYAKAMNSVPASSACSTATMLYNLYSFSGISSVDLKTDSTLRINWSANSGAVSYSIYNTTSGSEVFHSEVLGQASTSSTLTGLTPGVAYKFRVKMKIANGELDGNTTDASVTMNAAPTVPSALTMEVPAASAGFDSTPTIKVSGVKPGDVITLYTDNLCATTAVATGTASGTTIDLTTSALTAGAINFYAKSTNSVPASSACSTATVLYTLYSFSGISSIDLKTDSTLRINWSANSGAVSYSIYNTTSGSEVFHSEVLGQASTSSTLTGLTPGVAYKFRVKMKIANGELDGNTTDASVTMNAAPTVPSALTMEVPAASAGFDSTPTIKVSGVKSGDVITLYTDNLCATTAVATGTASGATIDLTTSALTVGAYNFYAKSTNSVPASSACSTATVLYTLSSCPDGFVEVPGSTLLGVNAFCVMQFEARQVAGVASSLTIHASVSPWDSINQIQAKTACLSLDPLYNATESNPSNPSNPSHYDLISNPEWLTIAHNVESKASNWSNNSMRSGKLPRGNSDGTGTLAITDVSDHYDGTGNNSTQAVGSGWEQKRTYTLDNGSVVWDLAGNLWEWVDWSVAPGLDASPSCETGTIVELKDVINLADNDCKNIPTIDYLPLDSTLTTAANGIGGLSGGSGGGGFRGGKTGLNDEAGLFTLDLYVSPGANRSDTGFRCVYRP